MQTIKRPATAINIAFSLVITLGALIFISLYEVSHASATSSYCYRQHNLSFTQKLLPVAQKRCKSEFKRITDEWITGLYTNSK
jgi:hypothetical protein